MENESKMRLLYLCKILYERTDDNHPLSTVQLIEILDKEYSIPAHRTTISKDIDILKEFGIDVIKIESTQNKYFIASRTFETPELKLLVDAVEASRFITEKKSRELVSKIETLTSVNKAVQIKRNLCIENRVRSANEKIYYIVDVINDAINKNKKISFLYFQYDTGKNRRLKNNGSAYSFSPYTLVWNGDYYYVVGFSDKHNVVANFRVDRIAATPEILEEDAVPVPETFDLSKYLKTTFRMFSAEPKTVELECDNNVMDSIIDRFGEDVEVHYNDPESFRILIEVAANHIFFSWIFGFQGKVRIVSPDSVKKAYADMIDSAAKSLNM